jgi:iron complex outermembrane receptor protein
MPRRRKSNAVRQTMGAPMIGQERTRAGKPRARGIMLLLASTAAIAGPAFAQEATPQAAAAETPDGDIIVTATRRAETLQTVPISIQALGTEKLEEQHIASFDDYVKLLPSVTFNSAGPSQAQFYFRGINSGGDGLDVGSQPTTGLYLDEIPVTTIGGSVDLHIYDVARVEALAGPQGTLFGASSLAGTLRIITNKPDLDKFEAGYDGQINKFGKGQAGGSAEGFANIPINDKMAIRLVGYYEHDGGYIDNTLKQRTYELDDKDPTTNVVVNNGQYVGKDKNDVDSYGGRAALRVELDDNWTLTPQIIYQHQKAKGSFLYDPAAGDLKVHDFLNGVNKDEWYQAALTIEGKVGNWDLIYSGGYFERWRDNVNDYSYYTVAYDHYSKAAGLTVGGADPFYYYTKYPDGKGGYLDPSQFQHSDYKYTKQTHEIRVNSPSENRLRVTFGAFMQRQTGKLDTDFFTKGISAAAALVPISAWPNPGLYPVPGFTDGVFIKRLDRVDKDYALFAEGNFDILDNLTLTAGIRGFDVKSSLYGFSGIAGLARNATRCVPAKGRYPCVSVNKDYKETGETHKVSLAWKITPRHMVYATYSTGFRPGGNDRRPTTPSYKADTVTNYEGGWKTSWGALRFNGAVFYEKWKDIQFSLPGENGQTYLLNAPGGASVKGIESDISWRGDGLVLTAAGAYIDAKLDDDFCARAGDCTPKGTRLPTTPKFKGSGTARYTFEMGDKKPFVQGVVNYQGSTRAGLLDSDTLPAADPITGVIRDQYGFTKGFATFDFSAGIKIGDISVEAFIENAFDKRGILSKSASCGLSECNFAARLYPIKPQLFGVKFGQRF